MSDNRKTADAPGDRPAGPERPAKRVAPGGFVVIIDAAPDRPDLRKAPAAPGRSGRARPARKGETLVTQD